MDRKRMRKIRGTIGSNELLGWVDSKDSSFADRSLSIKGHVAEEN